MEERRPCLHLSRFQQELIDAVAPFTTKTGSASAFVTTPEDPGINQPTIDYVAAFVPKASGKHFNPHVTIGIATQAYLKKMLAEPFDAFMFSPVAASVYQLGDFGTARKKLKTWAQKPRTSFRQPGDLRSPIHSTAGSLAQVM